jgi:hypothetical protein
MKGLQEANITFCWLSTARVDADITGSNSGRSILVQLQYQLRQNDERFADDLIIADHFAIHHFNDPAYPIDGRVARSGEMQTNRRHCIILIVVWYISRLRINWSTTNAK